MEISLSDHTLVASLLNITVDLFLSAADNQFLE